MALTFGQLCALPLVRFAEQSRRLGAKLVRVNNRRIFLDELDPMATGKPLKSMKAVECGIFCEEPIHE